jgi:hypothetical protein
LSGEARKIGERGQFANTFVAFKPCL